MKTMFVVSFEEFQDEDGCDLKIPIAVCSSEKSAWKCADVMPFECNVTEVILIDDEVKITAGNNIVLRNGEVSTALL